MHWHALRSHFPTVGLRLLFLFIASALAVFAQDLPKSSRAPLRSVGDFWNLPPEEKKFLSDFDFTVTVLYYDPEWNLLWGDDTGIPFFLPVAKGPLAIKSGQHVRIQGLISERGIQANADRIQVLPRDKDIAYMSIDGRLNDVKSFSALPCYLELLIDGQTDVDARHVLLSGVAQGRRINVRVRQEPGEIIPVYDGAFVRAKGVFVRSSDTTQSLDTLELWVSGPDDLQLRSWLSSDSRFDTPLVAIETLRDATATGKIVKIVGNVQSQNPGQSLTVRDETGQIILQTPQVTSVKQGDRIEAVGVPATEGVQTILREALYRPAREGIPPDTTEPALALPRLRLVDQIRKLSVEQARQHYPVKLYAVVTWAHHNADFFFVQDSSGGVRVQRPPNFRETIRVGSLVDIVGNSIAGNLVAEIRAHQIEQHASINLPAAQPLTLEQAQTGISEHCVVEITGFVRELRQTGQWMRLELTTSSGEFSTLLPASESAGYLKNAVVRARGVCTNVPDEHGREAKLELWANSAADFHVVGALPADPFSLPQSPIAQLDSPVTLVSGKPWVRTKGTVTFHQPGRYLYLQDGRDSLMVLSRDPAALKAGDSVEAVGLPGFERGKSVLREAILRRLPSSQLIAPAIPGSGVALDQDLENRLVRMEGVLMDCTPSPDGLTLVLRSGQMLFEAHLLKPAAIPEAPPWRNGSHLNVTGIYVLERNEYLQAQGFHVALRSTGDIEVTREAPWWTPQRALVAFLGLAVLGLLAAAWIVLLRRQVQEQTKVIRAQMDKEARMMTEIERSARLESLGTLAGGIAHDFNNILTIIIGNLSLAKLETDLQSFTLERLGEAERGAQRARSLTQQLLTFARGGNPVRKAQALEPLVVELCNECIDQKIIACSYEFPAGLRHAHIDRDQIAQVLKNILVNAVQAMPNGGRLILAAKDLELSENQIHSLKPGHYLRLSISDTGSGIPPEDMPKLFDPYFSTKGAHRGLGLATVRSIIAKHDGAVEVASIPGEGSTFTLYLPASKELPAAVAAAVPVPGPTPARLNRRARILFMDDETSIQTLVAGVFKKMGFDYKLASDGMEALDFYRNAMEAGQPFDLVLTDLTVPKGMGGKELMEELLSLNPKVRVLVSSGYSNDPVLAHYTDYGFVACVPKPYEIEELQHALNQALGGTAPPFPV